MRVLACGVGTELVVCSKHVLVPITALRQSQHRYLPACERTARALEVLHRAFHQLSPDAAGQ